MSRKPKKGYFVRGQFVAEGSELDLQLKAELKGSGAASKTDLKRESTELQKLGEALLSLPAARFDAIDLPESLVTALAEARRITNFEGRRRQMQYVGKLMRKLGEEEVARARAALERQHEGSAEAARRLHALEAWRERLVADDAALTDWVGSHPESDAQALRALIRQARREASPDARSVSEGLAPRRGRAWRALFQLLKKLEGGPDDGAAAGDDASGERVEEPWDTADETVRQR